MKSSCISHDKREPLIIIRKSYVDFCNGDHCSAALLSYFEYWHNIKLDMQKKAEFSNTVAANHGEEPTQDTSLYQFHTAEDLVDGMLGLFGIRKIRESLEQLKKVGVISIHRNPNPRYKFDNTRYFLLNIDALQKGLFDIAQKDTRSGEKDTRSGEKDTRSGEKDTTITENPTETTTETTTVITKDNINSADAQKTKKLGLKDLLALNIEQQYAQDWLEVRKVKRAALTQTAINLLIKEALIAKISVNDAVRICAENSWQGFKAEWYFKLNNNQPNYQQKKEADRKAHNRAAVDEFLRGFEDNAIDGEYRHV